MHRVFSTRYELTCKFENLRNRVSSTMMCNSQIAKSFSGEAKILVRKWLLIMKKHFEGLCSQGCSSWAQAQILTGFVTLQRRHYKLSRDTKIIENRHWELRQSCAGKLTKVRKLCWKSDTFLHPGDRQSLPNLLWVGLQVRNFKNRVPLAATLWEPRPLTHKGLNMILKNG